MTHRARPTYPLGILEAAACLGLLVQPGVEGGKHAGVQVALELGGGGNGLHRGGLGELFIGGGGRRHVTVEVQVLQHPTAQGEATRERGGDDRVGLVDEVVGGACNGLDLFHKVSDEAGIAGGLVEHAQVALGRERGWDCPLR